MTFIEQIAALGKPRAIETTYRGFLFRSRLEARWAIFFDKMRIDWAYEPEGYELPTGRYLPDFYLTAENIYLEVKPGPKPPMREEWFDVSEYSGLPIRRAKQLPPTREQMLMQEISDAFECGGMVVYGEPWVTFLTHNWVFEHNWVNDPAWLFWDKCRRDVGKLKEAALAARQARFEHGAQL